MDNIIDANNPEYLVGVLKNIERRMPKAWRKRTTNIQMVKDFLMCHTSKGGRTSSYEMCKFLGVDADGYTFYKPIKQPEIQKGKLVYLCSKQRVGIK